MAGLPKYIPFSVLPGLLGLPDCRPKYIPFSVLLELLGLPSYVHSVFSVVCKLSLSTFRFFRLTEKLRLCKSRVTIRQQGVPATRSASAHSTPTRPGKQYWTMCSRLSEFCGEGLKVTVLCHSIHHCSKFQKVVLLV